MEFRYRTISVDELGTLEADFKRTLESGRASSNEVFRSYLSDFSFAPPEEMPAARSVIVVALPQQITQVNFHHRGGTVSVLVPPGYVSSGRKMADLKHQILAEIVGDTGGRLEVASLPLKLLAARSGLGRYGKNNICFVDGLGSYHSLLAFFAEEDLAANDWYNVRMLRECKGCDICVRACPTECIKGKPFVIDVGRCVTLYNELPDTMPAWIDPHVHNALIGCMRCQYTCPVNAAFKEKLSRIEDVTETETTYLLGDPQDEERNKAIQSKLARIGFSADLTHLGRNLKLVLEA